MGRHVQQRPVAMSGFLAYDPEPRHRADPHVWVVIAQTSRYMLEECLECGQTHTSWAQKEVEL